MKLTYKFENQVNANEVADVFKSSGIRRPVHDLGRINRMFTYSNLIVSARDNGKLVGIARALTDFSYCCYLSDLAVRKEYQRQGVGRELIRRVQQAIGQETMLLLLSAAEADGYYPHIGFEKVNNAWQTSRKR
ncbi:MAG: GNAT family N-acetyltransferase [candidate division Zixibacteria bacterium RBG_16_50_21]|nr:MAG: GNAT family N-acetyltransferase [candidate division Zixibacteria bacterium RBG_16_50_21]